MVLKGSAKKTPPMQKPLPEYVIALQDIRQLGLISWHFQVKNEGVPEWKLDYCTC